MADKNNKRELTPDSFLVWFPVVVRYGAIVGVAHQAIFARFDRPYLLALYGAALGLTGAVQEIIKMRQQGSSKEEKE